MEKIASRWTPVVEVKKQDSHRKMFVLRLQC
jgi:hypothetical protein